MFKRDIKKRTYQNFMLVMREIIGKGYDTETAWKITDSIFTEVEYNPMGLSVKQRVEMIVKPQ